MVEPPTRHPHAGLSSTAMARSRSSPTTSPTHERGFTFTSTPTALHHSTLSPSAGVDVLHPLSPPSPHLHPIGLPPNSGSISLSSSPSPTLKGQHHPRTIPTPAPAPHSHSIPPSLSLSLSPTRRHTRLPSTTTDAFISSAENGEHFENRIQVLKSGQEEGGEWDIPMPLEGGSFTGDIDMDGEVEQDEVQRNDERPALSANQPESSDTNYTNWTKRTAPSLPLPSPPRHHIAPLPHHHNHSAPAGSSPSSPSNHPISRTPNRAHPDSHPHSHSPLASCARRISISMEGSAGGDTVDAAFEGIERAMFTNRDSKGTPRDRDRERDRDHAAQSQKHQPENTAIGNGRNRTRGTKCETCTDCGAWRAEKDGSLGLESLCVGERF